MIQTDTLETIINTSSSVINSINILDMINVSYILCTMITIYSVIKLIENNKPISSYIKSAIVLSIGLIYGLIFDVEFNANHNSLLSSFVLSTFGYDLIIKPLLRKLGLHYKDYKTTDKAVPKI